MLARLAATGLSLAAAGMALVALSSCGSGGEERTVSSGGQGSAATVLATKPAPDPAARPDSPACQRRLGGFLQSLRRLRSDLAAGLSYSQYRQRVQGARDAYDSLAVERLPVGCLIAAGTPAERAFNEYVEAANAWGACLADAGCDATVVEPELQAMWRRAEDHLAEADPG